MMSSTCTVVTHTYNRPQSVLFICNFLTYKQIWPQYGKKSHAKHISKWWMKYSAHVIARTTYRGPPRSSPHWWWRTWILWLLLFALQQVCSPSLKNNNHGHFLFIFIFLFIFFFYIFYIWRLKTVDLNDFNNASQLLKISGIKKAYRGEWWLWPLWLNYLSEDGTYSDFCYVIFIYGHTISK